MAIPYGYRRPIARYGGGALDRLARRKYGVTGYGLLAKLLQGESTWDMDAVSSAGARAAGQFMPGTRQAMISAFGVDPWRSKREAVKGARLHLLGKLGHAQGLEGYNPGGGQSYVNYILGQDAGKVQRELRRRGLLDGGRGRGGGSGPPRASGAVSAPLSPIPVAGQTGAPAPYGGVAEPEHTARRFLRLPDASPELPQSGAPPSPDASFSSQVAAAMGSTSAAPAPVLRLGGGQRFAGLPGATAGRSGLIGSWMRNGVRFRYDPQRGEWVRPGSGRTPEEVERRRLNEQQASSSGPMVGRRAYPAARRGSLIGTPYGGTHTLGNWQSDNALDIGLRMGTPIRATTDGRVVKTGGSSSMEGRFGGFNLTIDGPRNSFFYTHLQKLRVKPGQRVRKGQIIGYSGSANGVPHLHIGVARGNPLELFGWR